MDRTQELEQQVQSLSRDVDEMRHRMAELQGGAPAPANGKARSNRRGFLRMGATAAAGALGWMAVKAVPAVAATGGNMLLGCPNGAANPTTLQTSAAVNPTLGVEDSAFSASNLNTALNTFTEAFTAPLQGLGGDGATLGTEGIDGWASGATAYAIWGFTDAGTGVTGESISGIGLYARATGRIRQDPQGTAGLPAYTPNLMEQVRDANGVLWIHNLGGVWRRVNSPRSDAADNSGSAYKPLRLVDTRSVGGPATNGIVRTYVVAPTAAGNPLSNIPADAIAVFGNLTAVGPTAGGWLTLFPAGVATNLAGDPSSLNFTAGVTIANSFFCGLGTGGNAGRISVGVSIFSGGHTNFILDITGYVQ